MASAAQSAANGLSAQESTGPRTPRCRLAMQRSPLRRPPAELGSTCASNRLGADPAKFVPWVSRANLLDEISARDLGKSQFHAAGDRSMARRSAISAVAIGYRGRP